MCLCKLDGTIFICHFKNGMEDDLFNQSNDNKEIITAKPLKVNIQI
jgi:hypothetical protein